MGDDSKNGLELYLEEHPSIHFVRRGPELHHILGIVQTRDREGTSPAGLHLLRVIGPPGVGKTVLMGQLREEIEDSKKSQEFVDVGIIDLTPELLDKICVEEHSDVVDYVHRTLCAACSVPSGSKIVLVVDGPDWDLHEGGDPLAPLASLVKNEALHVLPLLVVYSAMSDLPKEDFLRRGGAPFHTRRRATERVKLGGLCSEDILEITGKCVVDRHEADRVAQEIFYYTYGYPVLVEYLISRYKEFGISSIEDLDQDSRRGLLVDLRNCIISALLDSGVPEEYIEDIERFAHMCAFDCGSYEAVGLCGPDDLAMHPMNEALIPMNEALIALFPFVVRGLQGTSVLDPIFRLPLLRIQRELDPDRYYDLKKKIQEFFKRLSLSEKEDLRKWGKEMLGLVEAVEIPTNR